MVVLGWVEVRHCVGVRGEVGGGWRSGPTEGAAVLVLCSSGFCDGEMDPPEFSFPLVAFKKKRRCQAELE